MYVLFYINNKQYLVTRLHLQVVEILKIISKTAYYTKGSPIRDAILIIFLSKG